MILKNSELLKSHNNSNPNVNKNILKKYISKISINNKNNKNSNIISTNGLSTTTHIMKKNNSFYLNNIDLIKTSKLFKSHPSSFIKTRAMSTKNIFRNCLNRKLSSAKTAKEMKNKFYLRYREGAYSLEKNYNLRSGMLKSHDKIVKKIVFDYKNLPNVNKEVLNNTISKYNRNLELTENQENVRRNQVVKDSIKFEQLKKADNRKKMFRSPSMKKLSESSSLLYSTPKYKSPLKIKPQLKEEKFEEKYHDILFEKKKYYNYKRLKENSKKYCQQVRNIERECDFYETIDDESSKLNLQQNIYYNSNNLERIIKVKGLQDERFSFEDYELNRSFLKKCSKDYSFYFDKSISGCLPSFVKKNHFLSRTINKYGYLQGKYFGLPV